MSVVQCCTAQVAELVAGRGCLPCSAAQGYRLTAITAVGSSDSIASTVDALRKQRSKSPAAGQAALMHSQPLAAQSLLCPFPQAMPSTQFTCKDDCWQLRHTMP